MKPTIEYRPKRRGVGPSRDNGVIPLHRAPKAREFGPDAITDQQDLPIAAAKLRMQKNMDELRRLIAEKDARREKRKLYMRKWRKAQS